MIDDRIYIIGPAIVALIIFAYMRNKQANRNDQRRQRLEDKKEELMEMLRKNNPEQENTENKENE